MRKIVAGLLVLIWATGLAEAQVAVTSGEHDGFTRIVLDLPGPMTWEIETADRRATVRLSTGDLGFDLSRVFDRIGRDRLSRLTAPAPSELQLDLACPCTVDGFLFRESYLVLDIREGEEDEKAAAATPAPPPARSPPALVGTLPELPVLPDVTGDATAQAFASAMEQLVTDAAVAGLLDMADHVRFDRSDTTPPPSRAESMPDHGSPFEGPGPAHAPALSCPPGAADLTRDWAGEAPYLVQLAQLRAALFDIAGQRDPAAHLALARFLVAQGQGREARFLLSGDTSGEAALVRAMAHVIEGSAPPDDDVFAMCGDLALWQALQIGERGWMAQAGFDQAALVRGFRGLSDPLRDLLADQVIGLLDNAGYGAAVDDIRAFASRVLPGTAPDQAAGTVAGAVISSGEAPDRAVQELLDRLSTIPGAASASAEDRRLLEAFRTEYRETRLEAALWAAEVRILMAEGRYPEAIALIAAPGTAPAGDLRALTDESLRHLADTADDIGFLRIVMAMEAGDLSLPPLSEPVMQIVAARKAQLGF